MTPLTFYVQCVIVNTEVMIMSFEADYIKIDEYAKRMSIHPRTAYRRFHKKSIEDFVSIITSFCARIYGNRRVKRKTEKI